MNLSPQSSLLSPSCFSARARLIQFLDPSCDRRIVGKFLARFFERDERVALFAEDEKNLHAKLDERLIQREVGERIVREKRQRAIDELQRHLRLRVVERVGGEAVEHARRIAEE